MYKVPVNFFCIKTQVNSKLVITYILVQKCMKYN